MNIFKKQIAVLSVVVIMAYGLTSVGYAEEGCDMSGGGKNGHHGGKKGEWMQKMLDEVGVSEDQKKALGEKRKENNSEKKAIREKMKEERKKLHEELKKEELDRQKIDQIVGEMKNLAGEEVSQRVEGFLAMREVLTQEQFSKLLDLKGKHKEKNKKNKKGSAEEVKTIDKMVKK
jgi:Spy/CpxP family protein refolding chaperone